MLFLWTVVALALGVAANTETYLVTLPSDFLQTEFAQFVLTGHRYPPNHLERDAEETAVLSKSATSHAFPIDLLSFVETQDLSHAPATKLFFRLCWPATLPYSFSFTHRYNYTTVETDAGSLVVPLVEIVAHYALDGVPVASTPPQFDLDDRLAVLVVVLPVGGGIVAHTLPQRWLLQHVNIPLVMVPVLGFVVAVLVGSISIAVPVAQLLA